MATEMNDTSAANKMNQLILRPLPDILSLAQEKILRNPNKNKVPSSYFALDELIKMHGFDRVLWP